MKYDQAHITRKLELLREQYRRECQEATDEARRWPEHQNLSGRADGFALAIAMLDNVLDDLRGAE